MRIAVNNRLERQNKETKFTDSTQNDLHVLFVPSKFVLCLNGPIRLIYSRLISIAHSPR